MIPEDEKVHVDKTSDKQPIQIQAFIRNRKQSF